MYLSTLTTAGILDLNNQDQTLAGLLDNGLNSRVIDSTDDATFPTLTLNIAGTNTFSGILGNANQDGFNVTKTGTGTLTLANANTYVGATNVQQGTLQLARGTTLPVTGTCRSGSTPPIRIRSCCPAGRSACGWTSRATPGTCSRPPPPISRPWPRAS